MQRHTIIPRNNWQASVEKLGFGFHTADVPYWNENAYYEFSLSEVNKIETATAELWGMCLEAVQYVIDHKLYAKFAIPDQAIAIIEKSWNDDVPAIYGRFDFGFDGTDLKLFEFNADTPTSLFEAGIVQWFWLQDFASHKDQFNSVHERLVDYWKYLKPYLHEGILHFTCVKQSLEDLTTAEYMRDCAIQAGIPTKLVFIDDIGWNQEECEFVDLEDQEINNIFKLYPWEWMVNEPFFDQLLLNPEVYWIEPAWKMILSNKAILPILWKLYPNCPYILECYFEEENRLNDYVKKPIYSREGANISIVKNGQVVEETRGIYGKEGFICQQNFNIPRFESKIPIIGSWIIGQQPSGMGIREDDSLITGNTSCFIPHLINN